MSWFCPKWFLFLISLVLGTMFHLAVPHTLTILLLFSAFLQMFFLLSSLFFAKKNYDKWQMFSVSNVLFLNHGPLCSQKKKNICSAHCSSMFTFCAHILDKLICSSILSWYWLCSFTLASVKKYLRDALFFQKNVLKVPFFQMLFGFKLAVL